MPDIEEQIEKHSQDLQEVRKLQVRVWDGKLNFAMSVLADLIESLSEVASKIVTQNETKEYFDKDLGNTLKSTITEIVTAFSSLKAPIVNFSPQVKVDFEPIAAGLKDQQGVIINLLNKLSLNGNEKNEDLYKLVVLMISKQNAFLERTIQSFDYTEPLKRIADSNKKEVVQKLVVEYDGVRIKEVVPIYKK